MPRVIYLPDIQQPMGYYLSTHTKLRSRMNNLKQGVFLIGYKTNHNILFKNMFLPLIYILNYVHIDKKFEN